MYIIYLKDTSCKEIYYTKHLYKHIMTMFPIDIDFSRLKEVLTYDPQAPMIFSSGIFLWLFAAFMVVYVLLQRKYTARI